jgi:uncharacterized membrane protein YukC
MSNDPYRKQLQVSPRRGRASLWVAIGAIFLIILLILWLTFADLTGNTDVAAFVGPVLNPAASACSPLF